MTFTRSLIPAAAVVMLLAGPSLSQHAGHAGHMETTGAGTLPSEPGQGAFAAIAEIVALLGKDPETDWSKVNLDALRVHLVDMNALVLEAAVDAVPLANGLEMRVSLDGRAGEAASRMVPAHGVVLAAETGWESEVVVRDDAIVWTVKDPTGKSVARIQALGFFGLMATGDHHRAHHLAMARGGTAH